MCGACNWNNDILVYGDATGTQGSTSSNTDSWEKIKYVFQDISNVSYEYKKTNPLVEDRIDAVNLRLKNADNEIGLYIDRENCKPLIADFMQVTRKEDGKVDKNRLERMKINHNVENLGYLVYQRFPRKRKHSYAGIVTEEDFADLI